MLLLLNYKSDNYIKMREIKFNSSQYYPSQATLLFCLTRKQLSWASVSLT